MGIVRAESCVGPAHDVNGRHGSHLLEPSQEPGDEPQADRDEIIRGASWELLER